MPDMTAIILHSDAIAVRRTRATVWSTSVWHRSPHRAFARASTAAIRVFIPASFASMIGFVYNESIPALEFLPTFYTSHRRNNCSKPSDATVTVSSGWHVMAGQ